MENIIDETTSKLRLSVAVQIIKNYIELEYNRFYVTNEPGFDYDELSNLLQAIEFYESQMGKKTGYKSAIEKALLEL
jgi:hypothetical protein